VLRIIRSDVHRSPTPSGDWTQIANATEDEMRLFLLLVRSYRRFS